VKIHDPRYQAFLKKLRAARESAGLTQSEAARRLGKRQAFIWKSETGERRVDFVETVLFAKLYGKKITYFAP
jgi:transcriptional regulator with XRE-family HTH domain